MTIKHLFPPAYPALDLNFADERELDPRITFTRSSIGTYVNDRGVVTTAQDNEPRFNFVSQVSQGLLIEEARTNSCPYSIDFSDYGTDGWNALNAVPATDATVVDPTGGTGAWGITETATIGGHGIIYRFPNDPSASKWTLSCFVKAGIYDYFVFNTVNAIGFGAIFDLVNGVNKKTNGGADYVATQEKLANGWWRVSVTGNFQTAGASNAINLGVCPTYDYSDYATHTPDTSAPAVYVYGAQVEKGGYLTAFIETNGATASRAQDVVSIDNLDTSDWFNQSAGTFIADFTVPTLTNGIKPRCVFGLGIGATGGGGNNDDFVVQWQNATTFYVASGNGNFINLTPSTTNRMRWAVGWSSNIQDEAKCVVSRAPNTVADFTVTANNLPRTKLRLGDGYRFGAHGGGGPFSCTYARLAYWPRQLTNEELKALTS